MHFLLCELENALAKPGCPICRKIRESENTFFAWFGVEYFHDFRMHEMLSNGGFCARHAEHLLSAGPLLSEAFRYITVRRKQFLLDFAARAASPPAAWLARLKPLSALRAYLFRRAKKALLPTKPCPACAAAEDTRRLFIKVLTTFLVHEPNRLKYRQNPGLCWRHLQDVLNAAPELPVILFLLDCHREQYQKKGQESEVRSQKGENIQNPS